MDISNLYDLFLSSTGICTDTRKLQSGQLYIALKGEKFNGKNRATTEGKVVHWHYVRVADIQAHAREVCKEILGRRGV